MRSTFLGTKPYGALKDRGAIFPMSAEKSKVVPRKSNPSEAVPPLRIHVFMTHRVLEETGSKAWGKAATYLQARWHGPLSLLSSPRLPLDPHKVAKANQGQKRSQQTTTHRYVFNGIAVKAGPDGGSTGREWKWGRGNEPSHSPPNYFAGTRWAMAPMGVVKSCLPAVGRPIAERRKCVAAAWQGERDAFSDSALCLEPPGCNGAAELTYHAADHAKSGAGDEGWVGDGSCSNLAPPPSMGGYRFSQTPGPPVCRIRDECEPIICEESVSCSPRAAVFEAESGARSTDERPSCTSHR
ncbi:hypothetical protein BDK51DRAFT_36857 [Blyttiomyces helicus]|uniref:Uncharacterized protein n=1 Tax=Blyttiomyces helicus TaxID=388810 RepID=A0A4P9WKL2_9FUNG|nr:hypothetical protein BDK51DRAFT_36857 [Blyttiomyces helicus]|eukprot:RKO92942.1 hypothetical protein BDK51DRAFT_36857 [Blyttiomyces helicus]